MDFYKDTLYDIPVLTDGRNTIGIETPEKEEIAREFLEKVKKEKENEKSNT